MISIVIPAYNEEKRLPGSLDKIQDYLAVKEVDAEIIVVVEKSEDRTLDVVNEYMNIYSNLKLIQNDRRYGKGYSVRRGVLASRGDLILFTDSDLSVPISQLDKFLPHFKDYDCCIGQRVQIKKQPLYRRAMGTGFRCLSRLVTGLGYRDTQCGFKMFTWKFARTVFNNMSVDGFSFDVEMLMLARQAGFRIKAVEVPWYNDGDSRVSPVTDSLNMLGDLFRIKKRLRKRIEEEFCLSLIGE